MMFAALFDYGLEDEKEAASRDTYFISRKSFDSFIDFFQVFKNEFSGSFFTKERKVFGPCL